MTGVPPPGDRERRNDLLEGIEAQLLDFISATYDAIGWPGVIAMMAIESAMIPLPSEIIMPLAGWMLIKERGHGEEWLLLAGLFGAVGNTLGSLVAYYAGAWGGRPLVAKYGRYILISTHDLDCPLRWRFWIIRPRPLDVAVHIPGYQDRQHDEDRNVRRSHPVPQVLPVLTQGESCPGESERPDERADERIERKLQDGHASDACRKADERSHDRHQP